MSVELDSRYTIADAFASYLKTNSPKKTQASQKIDIRVLTIAKWFLEKSLGLTLMDEVRVEHLEQFEIWASESQECDDMTKPCWSPATVLRHGKTLKSIFRKAFLTGRIPRDPSALWRLSAVDPMERRRPMTDQEFSIILNLAPDWFKPILRLLAMTGARGSSVARLRWNDIDKAAGVLYFTSRKGGRKREKRNPFPLAIVQDVLNSVPRSHEFIFMKNGNPIKPELISMTGYRLIKKAGLIGVVLYGLRHKFATDLLKAGTSTEIARRLMGHANESMLKNYSQFLGIDPLAEAVYKIKK